MAFLPKTYKIEEMQKINKNVKLIKIKSNINPFPGKFFEVSIPGVGEAPLASCSYDDKYLNILMRRAGNVTSRIFELDKGDEIFIRGPYGRGFPINELKGHDLIFVAGGTGIAPVTSFIEYVEKNRKDFGQIFIYFGFKNQDRILLKDRVKKWSKEFKVHVCLDEQGNDAKCYTGFVNDIIDKQKPIFYKENTYR